MNVYYSVYIEYYIIDFKLKIILKVFDKFKHQLHNTEDQVTFYKLFNIKIIY